MLSLWGMCKRTLDFQEFFREHTLQGYFLEFIFICDILVFLFNLRKSYMTLIEDISHATRKE